MVWTSSNAGEFFNADRVIVRGGKVFFLEDFEDKSKIIKTYSLQEFMKYNPDWKLLENTE